MNGENKRGTAKTREERRKQERNGEKEEGSTFYSLITITDETQPPKFNVNRFITNVSGCKPITTNLSNMSVARLDVKDNL
jgi:hypothetical protein